MKNQIIILLAFVLISLSFIACEGEKKVKTDTETENKQTKTVEKCKSLFIIAEDRSGSTSDHRKLTATDYKKVFNQFQQKADGQIAVRVIGNPAPSEREFFMLPILSQKELQEVPQSAKMSIKGKIRKENRLITEENNKIATKNIHNIDGFISEKISKHVLNYHPNKNKDITNIDDALKHLEMKVNEPTFRNYDNINILIVSDGLHDATKLKSALIFNPKPRVNVFLIGWKDKSVFNSIASVDSFESVDGFIAYYKTLKCKK